MSLLTSEQLKEIETILINIIINPCSAPTSCGDCAWFNYTLSEKGWRSNCSRVSIRGDIFNMTSAYGGEIITDDSFSAIASIVAFIYASGCDFPCDKKCPFYNKTKFKDTHCKISLIRKILKDMGIE